MIDLKIFADEVEKKASEQIYALCNHPAFRGCKVRIMPDVHAGTGCVIGFTADLGEKVIPNVVGVDIGCGMLTIGIGKQDIDFNKLDKVIRTKVPCGMTVHKRKTAAIEKRGLFCFEKLNNIEWINSSKGTLGGGNHFIEIDEDENGNRYLIVHSGSRNLGKQVCEIYQNIAISNLKGRNNQREKIKQIILECKASGREKEISDAIKREKSSIESNDIPNDLCYLTGHDRLMYLHDMEICQDFAQENRVFIAYEIMEAMGWREEEAFQTVHNYIGPDNIVRKGAISAYKGQPLLIPLNMRDGCVIGTGKGNTDWNCSAPHGAGRKMSRREAKETITIDEFRKTMNGVFSTCIDQSTIDESPFAYKLPEIILSRINDTVEIEKIIKPIYNFKATE